MLAEPALALVPADQDSEAVQITKPLIYLLADIQHKQNENTIAGFKLFLIKGSEITKDLLHRSNLLKLFSNTKSPRVLHIGLKTFWIDVI